MGEEVVDVHLDQRTQGLARWQAAGGDGPRQVEQLLSSQLEDRPVHVVLARKDGVDRAHRQRGELRDLLDLGRVEATFREDLLGRLEDVLAIDAGARLACLVAWSPSHECPSYHSKNRLTSRFSEW